MAISLSLGAHAAEIKTAAAGRWREILTALGVQQEFLVNRHGPCPVCGGRDRFRFDNKGDQGTFFCTGCGAGDGFKLLMLFRSIGFREAVELVASVLGGVSVDRTSGTRKNVSQQQKTDWQAYHNILSLWQRGLLISPSDAAGKYLLETRGINIAEFPAALRFVPDLEFGKSGEQYPSMLAGFTNSGGELVQVERFILTETGQRAFPKHKFWMPGWREGAMKGGSIKLFEPTDVLAVGEGVETCLAFHAHTGIPVWAAANAGMLEQVIVPPAVTRIIILADNDSHKTDAGRKAAEALAVRLSEERHDVSILMPDEPGTDFADLFKSRTGVA